MTGRARDRLEIWCEDHEQEAFLRALLTKKGFHRRALRFELAPSGSGSASQWVLAQRETIVARARTSRKQRGLGFIVMIDGDNQPEPRRSALLEKTEDSIFVLVPTWEIETWVVWLSGHDIDESVSCKSRLPKPDFYQQLPQAIDAWDVERPEELNRVPSLARARQALQTL